MAKSLGMKMVFACLMLLMNNGLYNSGIYGWSMPSVVNSLWKHAYEFYSYKV